MEAGEAERTGSCGVAHRLQPWENADTESRSKLSLSAFTEQVKVFTSLCIDNSRRHSTRTDHDSFSLSDDDTEGKCGVVDCMEEGGDNFDLVPLSRSSGLIVPFLPTFIDPIDDDHHRTAGFRLCLTSNLP